jgi:hypothetical protein
MPSILSTTTRALVSDRFEPESPLDPQDARKLRGYLDQIDYAAFAANREVVGHAMGRVDIAKFERLAIAAAQARVSWVAAALAMTESAHVPTPEQVGQLSALRSAYFELTAVYKAMRRMVERGYLNYQNKG